MSEAWQSQEKVWWQNDLWKSNFSLRQTEMKCYTSLYCMSMQEAEEGDRCHPGLHQWCAVEENTTFQNGKWVEWQSETIHLWYKHFPSELITNHMTQTSVYRHTNVS